MHWIEAVCAYVSGPCLHSLDVSFVAESLFARLFAWQTQTQLKINANSNNIDVLNNLGFQLPFQNLQQHLRRN